MAENAIEFCEITKRSGEITTSDHVSFSLKKGEVLALLGENGSGKTTLMNMPSGICFPDDGQIKINGEVMSIQSPKDAFRLGIGMIHQHFKLIPMFSTAENIILDGQGGKYDSRAAEQELSEFAERYGFRLNPKQKVYKLLVSEEQTVEIVKVLYRGVDILVLDKPTTVLTPQETERPFAILREIRENGKSILIITHKLTEILALSNRVAVLRKGRYIGTVKTIKADVALLAEMMVGEKVKLGVDRAAPLNGPKRLRLGNVTYVNAEGAPALSNLSLALQGEGILGITGIAGNGQRKFLKAITGLIPYSGEICYGKDDGSEKNLKGMTPTVIEALSVRLVFVPEDRLDMGLVDSMDLTDNVMLRSYRNGASFVTDREKPKERTEQIVEELSVATSDATTPTGRLLGGNVQKVLVGHEVLGSPKVVMTTYPVRGPDVHSSYMIYQLLNERRKKGNAVVCVGEDLDMLLELCGHILVLQGGKSAGILNVRTASEEELGRRMMDGRESEV